jgi:hypothetical protein
MKQRLIRQQQHADYVSNIAHSSFSSNHTYTHVTDRVLMKEFIRQFLYSSDSTSFIKVCAELGARGYDPEYNKIREALR